MGGILELESILKEVKFFGDFVLNYNNSNEYDLLQYRYCPLKNICYEDILKIYKILNVTNIVGLILVSLMLLKYNMDDIDKIRLYMHITGFDMYAEDFLQGNLHVIKKQQTTNEIIDNYNNIDKYDYANTIGNYSELIVYNSEITRVSEEYSKRIIWASREIGDIFGYDILSYHDSGLEKLIEVKGTNKGHNMISLSNNEKRLFFLNNNDYKYYIYHVDLLNKITYEITNQNGNIVDQFGNSYYNNNYKLIRRV